MYNYTLPSLILFLLLFISVPQIQAQITLNSSGSVTFDNHATIDGNTTLHGSVNIGTTVHHSSRLYIYNNQGLTSKIGIRAYTLGSGSVYPYGVPGVASGSSGLHRGLHGQASGGSSSNYGIYASASGSNNWAGYFNGDVLVTGSIVPSDERLKTEVGALQGGQILPQLLLLQPKRYRYLSEEELRNRNLPVLHTRQGDHFGLIAQELEQVFPELVTEVVHILGEDTGEIGEEPQTVTTKAVNYQELTALLLAAIQEQQEKIEEFEVRLQAVENNVQD